MKNKLYTTIFATTPVEVLIEGLKAAVLLGAGSPVLQDTADASVTVARSTGYNGDVKTYIIEVKEVDWDAEPDS